MSYLLAKCRIQFSACGHRLPVQNTRESTYFTQNIFYYKSICYKLRKEINKVCLFLCSNRRESKHNASERRGRSSRGIRSLDYLTGAGTGLP